MLHSCAEYLTHTLYRHCPLSEEKRPVFVYGFELSLSTLSSILSIILLSIIFKNVYSSLLFLYTFFFLRLFSGGYHAPTYSKCFILTNAIFAFARRRSTRRPAGAKGAPPKAAKSIPNAHPVPAAAHL